MKKVFAYLLSVAVGFFSLHAFLGSPAKGLVTHGITGDILSRRNFLANVLSARPDAQDFFRSGKPQYTGEWMLGAYAMAAYALTNIAMMSPGTAGESSRIISEWIKACMTRPLFAFDEIAWAGESPLSLKALGSDRGHIGYYGHLNLMLGCYALLNNDGQFRQLHRQMSDCIARRMLKHSHRHIETYPSQTYPADNTVAAASLRVADRVLDTDYKGLVDEWVQQSRLLEIQPYGLIVFQIDSVTGKPLQSCRGSHMGWNSFFMPLVDRDYAVTQFQRYKKYMLREFLCFAAFKEFARGHWFAMDCDTGPVIFGLGGTATAFAVAGARWMNDEKLLNGLLRSVELFGVSLKKGDTKRYIAFPLVGDAILLAMKTAVVWEPLWK